MLRHRADWRCVLWVAKYFGLTALRCASRPRHRWNVRIEYIKQ